MPAVVGEKADLDEDEGQEGGVQELQPSAAEGQQQAQARRQHAERESELAREVGGLPAHQSSLFDDPLQLGVLVGLRPGRGLQVQTARSFPTVVTACSLSRMISESRSV